MQIFCTLKLKVHIITVLLQMVKANIYTELTYSNLKVSLLSWQHGINCFRDCASKTNGC
jgi:hypothetical protein